MRPRVFTDPQYCPVLGAWWTARPVRLPRPVLRHFTHRCPDGVIVSARAQYIPTLHRSIYRFRIGDRQVGRWVLDGLITTPDWTGFDLAHPLPAPAMPEW